MKKKNVFNLLTITTLLTIGIISGKWWEKKATPKNKPGILTTEGRYLIAERKKLKEPWYRKIEKKILPGKYKARELEKIEQKPGKYKTGEKIDPWATGKYKPSKFVYTEPEKSQWSKYELEYETRKPDWKWTGKYKERKYKSEHLNKLWEEQKKLLDSRNKWQWELENKGTVPIYFSSDIHKRVFIQPGQKGIIHRGNKFWIVITATIDQYKPGIDKPIYKEFKQTVNTKKHYIEASTPGGILKVETRP